MRADRRPRARGGGGGERTVARGLTLRVDTFTREALEREARELGVSVEELTNFAVLYYLADHDSGRIARRPPVVPSPDGPQPETPPGG